MSQSGWSWSTFIKYKAYIPVTYSRAILQAVFIFYWPAAVWQNPLMSLVEPLGSVEPRLKITDMCISTKS